MRRLTPLVLAVALFMEQMDSTVISTSLPAIAADIGSEPVALKLALTSYLVALAIFIPISGWMSDRFGARNLFRLAIFIFVLGSIACAFSGSLEAFVLSRFFQGMGASMMTPVGRLLLVRSTPRNELVSAMAWLSIPAMIGPLVGPPLGGFLTTYLSWHWIFWINVPIGLGGIVLASRFLPTVDERTPRPIDAIGFLLSSVAFSGVLFGASVISLPALPIVYGYLTLALGVVSGLFYLLHAKRTRYPLLDPRLFRYPLFRAAIVGGSLFRLGMGAVPFLLPLMLQLGFGFTAFQAGLTTFVSAIGATASKFLAPGTFRRFGFRNVLTIGTFVSGLLMITNGFFEPGQPIWILMAILLVSGLIRSVAFTGVNAMAFSDIQEADASQATAITAVFQQLSLAMGVALAGAVIEVSGHLRGAEPALFDFHVAFYIVGGLSALAAISFLRLSPTAGAETSGHQQALADELAETAPAKSPGPTVL